MKKVIISGVIEVITGLHIGSNEAEVRIGGLENGVIKDKQGKPYIPGSSLKGKMRCLLEIDAGKRDIVRDYTEPIGKLFGTGANNEDKDIKRSHLIVRDANIKENKSDNIEYTELKTENVINRKNGTAEHPRTIERVVKGTEFSFEFIFNSYYIDDKGKEEEIELLELLRDGMKLLEYDYLGGNGTRGYGQIKFRDMKHNIIDFKQKNTQEADNVQNTSNEDKGKQDINIFFKDLTNKLYRS
ncbi:MAG: type III-A CRISPR-associated RAMP protein Csm3 [Vallitalea sp.]|jgi:CRISPR-associated protein Csm3|nr:type III-A CRISPR-associated RAMP protein Csm3 [Vallitalea sp.]